MDYSLLKKMCSIYAPAGQEENMTDFLLKYVKKESKNWSTIPEIYAGDDFQNSIVLVFGKPTTAIFAHIDSIGFTVKYDTELVRLGGPKAESGYKLVGEDSKGKIECELKVEDSEHGKKLSYVYNRLIDRGTNLTFKPKFIEDKQFVQCCYMDNRLGVFNALKVAETLKNGVICFSCWEETGGGSVEYLIKFLYEKYKIKNTLISDITWVTKGVEAGKGVAISMRDSGIPRKKYINSIVEIASKSSIPYQIEVEDAGGSDGNIIHKSPYPIDWCFIGAPEQNVHSPLEKVHKKDIDAMIDLYKLLMKKI